MAITITIHAAKTQLSKLIAKVEAGEEVIIARGEKPVARLVPVRPDAVATGAGGPRGYGLLKGKLDLPDSFFFDPLPEEELELFEGENGS